MKNSKLSFIYVLIMIFFSACSVKPTAVNINHYYLDLKSKESSFISTSKSIYIESINVNKSFNSNSIFYSIKPYLFEAYAKNRWMDFPSYMIFNNVSHEIENSKIFKYVLKTKSKVDYDYILKTDVLELYHKIENSKSYAMVKVRFILLDDKKVIKIYSYNKKILCETTDAYGFVKASNKAFEEIMDDLLQKLNKI